MGDRPTKRHRVFVEDARRNGGYLRATWHPERRVFVLSTWDGDVCTGAVRVPAADAADLVALVTDGLAELAAAPPVVPAPTAQPPGPGRWAVLRTRLARWLDGGPGGAGAIAIRPVASAAARATERRRSA